MTIRKVLIANRGEIAARIARTLDRMGIASVALYHAIDAGGTVVTMAGEAVEVRGDPPVAAYLDADQIIAAAKATGADAIHPGFGFLSENADFARAVTEAGIVFIGPSPDTIALMGNKIVARRFCQDHGFPLAPSAVDRGDPAAFLAEALAIGAPLLVKAAAGGGGKGMQIVREAEALEGAIALARREAARSFGDPTVYVERYVEQPRHIEVQVLADGFGNVVHLGERECSIQRRFQKVIEEAPSPALDAAGQRAICETAVRIARAAGYTNAGTVEFIMAPDGAYYFLEMNTRIQVEHPVTEAITGIDLIEQQIRVAAGERLAFGQDDIALKGHAIEVRLYAEDPASDFAPSTGRLLAYALPADGVRIESGTSAGQWVTAAFDPMLAKLITDGADRGEAVRRMLDALAATMVMGVTTNLDYLARVLAHPAFGRGELHTGFLADYAADLVAPPLDGVETELLLAAAAQLIPSDRALAPVSPLGCMGGWQSR